MLSNVRSLTVRSSVDRFDYRPVTGYVTVAAVDVTHCVSADQDPPEVGVELDAMFLKPSIHLNASQHGVPLFSGLFANALKVTVRELGLEILQRLL